MNYKARNIAQKKRQKIKGEYKQKIKYQKKKRKKSKERILFLYNKACLLVRVFRVKLVSTKIQIRKIAGEGGYNRRVARWIWKLWKGREAKLLD